MKYRSEIDGLRAIAVFPVILFHAGFELFNGGFVGVDIFFVISGYLITSIIINELEEGNFSLAKFYERRVRRIFPALFFVVFVCIPFAWMWLTPLDMKEFSKSLIAVATFSSNILFWKESGYFDTEAELKPLLHTWSLAVEEQYYIIFPVFLMFAWKLGGKFVITALVVIFLASIATAHWGSYHKPYTTFYLLPTRVWELLLGAFCAFILNGNPSINTYTSQYGSIIGLTLITVAVFMFSSSTPTPSLFTLFPTVGAALVILFARNGNFVAKLLSTKIMIGLGLLSYSIYLWHQPIFAFARHRSTEPLSNFIYLMLCVLTIFLAFLTWKYIENPFRDRDRIRKSRVFMISTISIILFFAIGASVHFDGVLTHRFDARAKEIISAESDRSGRHKVLGNVNSQIHSVLIGDSHANSLQDSLHSGLTKISTAMTIETVGGCPPVYGLIRHDLDYGDKCHRRYKDIYQKILNDPNLRLILVSARFTLYLETTRFDNSRGGIEKGASDNVLYDTIEYGDRIRPLEERKKPSVTRFSMDLLN